MPVEGGVEDDLAVDDAWMLVESRGWRSAAKRERGCGANGMEDGDETLASRAKEASLLPHSVPNCRRHTEKGAPP